MTKNCGVRSPRRPRFAGTGLLIALLAGIGLSVGCGGRSGGHKQASAAETPAAAPTPDTTPVEVLRTPAGLVLKPVSEQPRPPSPAAEPTPKSSR